MRERGLKPATRHHRTPWTRVAPHAGAWVETPYGHWGDDYGGGRSPCGSVG